MKVLVIGSGGREHAIAWKLAQSPLVEQIFVAPGNGGTALEAKCQNYPVQGDPATTLVQQELLSFAREQHIDMTVVGPEAPLASGIVDRFRAAGLTIVGPTAAAARLEASKVYAKEFMRRYGIRTARSWSTGSYEAARTFAENYFIEHPDRALVIKADGLAAGKGVVIVHTFPEADATLQVFMISNEFGESGHAVVLEEFIEGKEVSILAAISASPSCKEPFILPFKPARDHKRRYEHAQGANTGGMGAICPVPDFSENAQEDFRTRILEPTLQGIVQEGFDYRGFLFFGLMVNHDTCYVLEYNVRLGDPETQAVLPLMKSDLAELCLAIEKETLPDFDIAWNDEFVCAPVAVAEGYPGHYRKGDCIHIDRDTLRQSGAKLFIAGAQLVPGAQLQESGLTGTNTPFITSGGRVLAVAASGPTLEASRNAAYTGLAAIHFTGMGFRTDIGAE